MIGQKFILLDDVDSTNNYAATLLNEGKLTHGTVILAEKQTAGRGQRGNSWSSAAGKQFACTVYAETAFLSAARYWYLNLAVAAAVRSAVQQHITEKVDIKWPNDLLVCDRKLGGILIETQWRSGVIAGAIIGVGVNLQPEPEVPQACALEEFAGETITPLRLAQEFALQLEERLQQLRDGRWNDLTDEYLEHLWKLGVETEARFPLWRGINGEDNTQPDEAAPPVSSAGEEPVIGVIRSIDANGNLLFDANGETRSYGLKEISFRY